MHWGLQTCIERYQQGEKHPTAKRLVAEVKSQNQWYYEVSKCAILNASMVHSDNVFSQLVRKTLSFSKKLENHIGAIRYFIHHHNASLLL